MDETYESTILGFVLAAIGDDYAISPDTDVRDIAGVDSLTLLTVVAQVEDHYQVQFPDDLVFDVHSIRQLADAVRQLQSEARSPARD